MKRRFYILFALGALALWGLFHQFKHVFQHGPQIGSSAPSFSLTDQHKKNLSLNTYRGKVLLLNFWATWCGPCRAEMPSLEALYQKYKDRGFVVVGISLDEEGWSVIEKFLEQVPVSFPIAIDQDQSVSEAYQTYRIPETFLIDTEGNIVDKFVGPQNYNQDLFFRKVERYLPTTAHKQAEDQSQTILFFSSTKTTVGS